MRDLDISRKKPDTLELYKNIEDVSKAVTSYQIKKKVPNIREKLKFNVCFIQYQLLQILGNISGILPYSSLYCGKPDRVYDTSKKNGTRMAVELKCNGGM
ncbi:hypothetical protein KIN20_013678 [Parelaphostrongylus tenuis]|uniref:Uncharacterized protein n=1 Tax=Parelaphostrongylus tenuis TaxID=148309 RepID=A0AAD5MCG9_PARTN|nr:hypothetical protein KIN20_013678 [Parelaphostrongylus tenuis]